MRSRKRNYAICESMAVPATPWTARRLFSDWSKRSVAGSVLENQAAPRNCSNDHNRFVSPESAFEFANAYYNRGTAYLSRGEHDKAIADYDEAIRLDPQHPFASSVRARLIEHLGDEEKAAGDERKA